MQNTAFIGSLHCLLQFKQLAETYLLTLDMHSVSVSTQMEKKH